VEASFRDASYIVLRLTVEQEMFANLRCGLGLYREDETRPGYYSGKGSLELTVLYGAFPMLPGDTIPGAPAEPNGPGDWRDDPALTTRVRVEMKDALIPWVPPGDTQPGPTPPPPKPHIYSLGEALDQLDSSQPVNLIADAFRMSILNGLHLENVPLGDALTEIAGKTMHVWSRQDGFVMFRSRTYETCRSSQPPYEALARWTARCAKGPLTLDDCAEIASLPDPQFKTLCDIAWYDTFPEDLSRILTTRGHLMLWNTLTPAQRKEAREKGLPYVRMASAQQRLFARNISDVAISDFMAAADDKNLPGLLPNARLRLSVESVKEWGIPGTDFTSSGIYPRSVAVKDLLYGHPWLSPADIREGHYELVKFFYENGERLLARGYIGLYPTWSD
jgi:hypothetical protein